MNTNACTEGYVRQIFNLVMGKSTFRPLGNEQKIAILGEKVTSFVTESGKIYDAKTLKRLDQENQ